MRFKLSTVNRFGILLSLGYLAFPWAHEYIPIRYPGLSALAFPSYVAFLSRSNPIARLTTLAQGEQFSQLGAAVLLCYLSICYFGVIRSTRRRQTEVTLKPILFWIAIFSLPLIVAPNMLSEDVYTYIMHGRIGVVHGANPMTVPPLAFPSDPLLAYMMAWKNIPAIYGPIWLIFSYGLTGLVHLFGQTPQLYMLAYKLTAIGLHMASASMIWLILGKWKPEQRVWGTLLYAWNPLAMAEFAGSAHNDAILIFFLLLGLHSAQQAHWRRATIGLSLSTLTKLVPVILLPSYAIFLARQRTSWKSRLAVVGQAAGISIFLAVLLYAPFWQGARMLDSFTAQPSMNKTINSLGDWAVNMLPRVTRTVSLGENPSATPGDQELSSAQQPSTPQPTYRPVFGFLVRRFGWALLPMLRLMANPWSGKVIMLLVWLWVCYRLWRQPSFERFVESCFWLLLTYILSATMWVWPWYTTWPLAVAALLDWKPAGRLMVVFTTVAWALYFGVGGRHYMYVYGPVFALIAWHLLTVLRRAGTDRMMARAVAAAELKHEA
jgi:hypothetical protein